jgi:6-phosphofructokinase 1
MYVGPPYATLTIKETIMCKNDVRLEDFTIPTLGETQYDSPLNPARLLFTNESNRILYHSQLEQLEKILQSNNPLPSFEPAGPRPKIFFNSNEVNCGIVTCGGLCPGINDVIRAIVYEGYQHYRVNRIYGFRNGYHGIIKGNDPPPVLLDTDMVNSIHEQGGTILGSSRGPQDTSHMVDYLHDLNISILFTIGGDGTLHGARAIAQEVKKRGYKIAVIGIPKTIDNDISFVSRTFGFETAVEASRSVIQAAHIESKGAEYGVGLVKLMGRDSGFIAAQATIANADVNFCLIPEVPFTLEGERGLLQKLEERLLRRRHAVIVVAEGAGQDLMAGDERCDASGNKLHDDIGIFLKNSIVDHFKKRQLPITVKYIDPSYIIRSRPSNANDSLVCLQMGQNAMHAGMAGKTDMMIGSWNNHYTHVPLAMAVSARKKINPDGDLWQTVRAVTEQGFGD